MYDIITVGSNTVDLFVHTDKSGVIDFHTKAGVKEFISYPVGAKMLITKLLHNFGGNGTNSAVAFSRLGLKTGYVGEVGKDENGKQILRNLKKEKVAFLGSKGKDSGFSIILDAMEEDRTILVYKGCNNDMELRELNKAKLKARWLYISSMLGKSLLTVEQIVEYAKKSKMKIAFNPSATLLENETKTALNIIRSTNILVLNKEESESLVGCNALEVNIQKLMVYGPKIIAITDGKNGALAYNDGYYYRVCARPGLKIVETTGAGDAFASTLVAGIMLKKPFEFCLKMAINNSESVITHYGAQNLLLSRKSLFDMVNKDDRCIEKRKA